MKKQPTAKCEHKRYVRMETVASYYDCREGDGEKSKLTPVDGWFIVCLECGAVQICIDGRTAETQYCGVLSVTRVGS